MATTDSPIWEVVYHELCRLQEMTVVDEGCAAACAQEALIVQLVQVTGLPVPIRVAMPMAAFGSEGLLRAVVVTGKGFADNDLGDEPSLLILLRTAAMAGNWEAFQYLQLVTFEKEPLPVEVALDLLFSVCNVATVEALQGSAALVLLRTKFLCLIACSVLEECKVPVAVIADSFARKYQGSLAGHAAQAGFSGVLAKVRFLLGDDALWARWLCHGVVACAEEEELEPPRGLRCALEEAAGRGNSEMVAWLLTNGGGSVAAFSLHSVLAALRACLGKADMHLGQKARMVDLLLEAVFALGGTVGVGSGFWPLLSLALKTSPFVEPIARTVWDFFLPPTLDVDDVACDVECGSCSCFGSRHSCRMQRLLVEVLTEFVVDALVLEFCLSRVRLSVPVCVRMLHVALRGRSSQAVSLLARALFLIQGAGVNGLWTGFLRQSGALAGCLGHLGAVREWGHDACAPLNMVCDVLVKEGWARHTLSYCPLDRAVELGLDDLCSGLLLAGVDTKTLARCLPQAVSLCKPRVVQALLDHVSASASAGAGGGSLAYVLSHCRSLAVERNHGPILQLLGVKDGPRVPPVQAGMDRVLVLGGTNIWYLPHRYYMPSCSTWFVVTKEWVEDCVLRTCCNEGVTHRLRMTLTACLGSVMHVSMEGCLSIVIHTAMPRAVAAVLNTVVDYEGTERRGADLVLHVASLRLAASCMRAAPNRFIFGTHALAARVCHGLGRHRVKAAMAWSREGGTVVALLRSATLHFGDRFQGRLIATAVGSAMIRLRDEVWASNHAALYFQAFPPRLTAVTLSRHLPNARAIVDAVGTVPGFQTVHAGAVVAQDKPWFLLVCGSVPCHRAALPVAHAFLNALGCAIDVVEVLYMDCM
jgi:hypothetical protein